MSYKLAEIVAHKRVKIVLLVAFRFTQRACGAKCAAVSSTSACDGLAPACLVGVAAISKIKRRSRRLAL